MSSFKILSTLAVLVSSVCFAQATEVESMQVLTTASSESTMEAGKKLQDNAFTDKVNSACKRKKKS